MKITYIHHSSFLVELKQVFLLFDYVGGSLPSLAADKTLIVFASHRHGDHFSPAIFDLAVQHPRIFYVLSDDIWQNQVPQKMHGCTEFIDPGEILELAEYGSLRVTAFKSTDEGVAYMVECEGHTIYHAGDLNDWRWNGETKAWNNNMHANYMRELEQIRNGGFHPKVAFVPLDGRLEEWFYLGLHEYMEQVGADMVFPMHFWEDYSVIGRLKELPAALEYRDKVADIREEGQEFLL